MTGSYGESIGLGLRMGNSICASKVAHLSLATSVATTDLVIFRHIGGDALISSFISSFDLLLFIYGAGVSGFTAEVEGIFLVP